jgi:hypothetical protein
MFHLMAASSQTEGLLRRVKAANAKPRIEPRPRWPRAASRALPVVAQRETSGRVVELKIRYHDGDRRLPIVDLPRVAA